MRVSIIPFLLSLVLIACQSKDPKDIDIENIDFMTTDASEIFFKNVRQSYYDKQEIAAAGMDIFRMSDRNLEADYPLIHLAIAYNWRNDQAFLMVEPNEIFTSKEAFSLYAVAPTENDSTAIEYTMGNMQTQVVFAHQLFQAISSDDQLFYREGETSTPIFDKFEDREVIRKTVLDYFKLIDLIR